MKKNVSILGCGWLGLPLGEMLCSKGYNVKGSTTSTAKTEILGSKSINPYLIQLDDLKPNIIDFLVSEILVVSIPSKNIASFEKLIPYIEASEVQKVLFISSTSVYANTNTVVTEESKIIENSLTEIEKKFARNNHFQCTVLRFGGLFGYDRKPGNFIRTNNKMDQPNGFVNLIHRDDCILIIEQIIAQNIWNETLNACADTHPTRREFYTREALKVGRQEPQFDENSPLEYKIINSDKLKKLLQFSFSHPDLSNLTDDE